MKKEVHDLVKKVLLLILPFIIILSFIEIKLSKIPNSYTLKKQYFENRLDKINVLILGSSHALYDINPDYFKLSGFNLSEVNQSIFYDTELTLKYINRMPSLNCVILSVSYFSFWYDLRDDMESWRDYYYGYFWDIRFPELKRYDPRLHSLILLYTPQKTKYFAKKMFRYDHDERLQSNGWLKMDTASYSSRITDESGKARVEHHNSSMFPERFNAVYSKLDNFIKELKKRNIDVVIITPPVYATYYKHIDQKIFQTNRKVIKQLSDKYNVKYIDYLKDPRFEMKDFYDNDHLNFIGAEKFSRILANDIDPIIEKHYLGSIQDIN